MHASDCRVGRYSVRSFMLQPSGLLATAAITGWWPVHMVYGDLRPFQSDLAVDYSMAERATEPRA